MKLVIGLGNPGRSYESTRHNVGFEVAARLAAESSVDLVKKKFGGEICSGRIAGESAAILWPMTFMNASGGCVRKAVDFYKLTLSDLLVVCDDLDLPVGRIRLRRAGSAGGQRGLADIIRHLDSDAVPRLRLGIGRPPPGWQVPDYVLGRFSSDERSEMDLAVARACDAATHWVEKGIADAMNKFNSSGKPRES